MSSHKLAVVWIDHHSARVVGFDDQSAQFTVLYAEGGPRHLHHKANSRGSGHLSEDQMYLHRTGQAIDRFEAVLITGPANEKQELKKHLERHDPAIARKVVALRTLDHPTDRQLLAFGRQYFASTVIPSTANKLAKPAIVS